MASALDAPRSTDAMRAVRPEVKNHGINGISAPTAKLTNDDSAHREGAGDEAGEPGEPDDAGGGAGTGHPEDERDVGEQAVADAEHGRPRSASLDVAVVRVHAVVSG